MSEPEKEYTHLEMEAALCVWEEINERTLLSKAGRYPELNKLREDWGSPTLRHASIHFGRFCLQVYDLLTEQQRDNLVYDWEFIPAVLDHIDWTQPGEPGEFEFKQPQEVVDSMKAGWAFNVWLQHANSWLKHGWSIDFAEAGASTEDMRRFFDENPERTGKEMAEWWADKYDLDRTDQAWNRI